MKLYEVRINLEIEAKDEREAENKFWERVLDMDYAIRPVIEEQK